jgi:predicted pyridoxine 5'-phosphate oxidase superfamily flavin-nucleotide-binding protein
MPTNFGSRVFTQVVKELQERYGSRRQYERLRGQNGPTDQLTEDESEFISERDTFYMATVGQSGWPYVQHRGGAKGFLKVVDANTLAFADYSGNKQYVSTGNLKTDERVALILVNYPHRARLKILGRAGTLEGDQAAPWIDRVKEPADKAGIERVYVIRVEAFEWNCQQYITPRYTVEELQTVLAPVEQRLQALEEANERLRKQVRQT